MRRRLLTGFLAFAAVVIVLLEVPFGISLANNARQTALAEIERDADSLSIFVNASLQRGDTADAQAIITRFSRAEHAVVAVASGQSLRLAAGVGAREEMRDPTTEAILRSASGGQVVGEEGSNDPDDDFLYVAIPLSIDVPGRSSASREAQKVGLVLLVAQPAAPLHALIAHDRLELLLFGASMLAVAIALGIALAISLTRPLLRIEEAVEQLGAGRLSVRVAGQRGPPEMERLRLSLNAMADRTEELLDAQRAFVADASHQLRTPMTALRLRLENFEGSIDAGDAAEWTSMISEVDRISRIVDGLLELARADGARPPLVDVDVAATLVERSDAWSALAEERGVTLAATHGDTGVPLLARAGSDYVEQILDNLLANALDATPPRGVVSLEARRAGDLVELRVIDSGHGMSPADRDRAFDRFWRHQGTSRDGTGLGLAIVAQLVHVCGGEAWLEESSNGGIQAVVRLPAGGVGSKPEPKRRAK
jgi:signal transduction histidine kinase